MGILARLKTFLPGTKATSADMNAELDNIIAGHNAIDSALTTHLGKAVDSTSPEPTKDKHVSNKDLFDIYASLNNKYNSTDVLSKAELQSTAAGNSGSDKVGSAPIAGVTGSTVFAQLSSIKSQINSAALGQIPEGSVGISKLSFDPATQVELDAVKSSVSDGKILVKNAITGKGGTVLDADGDGFPTHQELANGVNTIQTSVAINGTAVDGDVLAAKTYYNTDAKAQRTGTMANRGALTITPGTTNQNIPAGYHNGSGFVVGDPDLNAANIKQGVNVFGIDGTLPLINPGNTQVWNNSTARTGTSVNTLVKLKETTINTTGIYRISFAMYANDAGTSNKGQIYVNGVARGTLRNSTGTSYQTFTEDLLINAGDVVSVWGACNTGSPNLATNIQSLTFNVSTMTFSDTAGY